MTNPDRRTSLRRKLVSAARAVVTYQTGLPVGCVRLERVLTWLRAVEPVEMPAVAAYVEATQLLPRGTERLAWDRAALRPLDVRLEAINREFRDRVFEECYSVIDRFGTAESGQGVA